MPDADTPDSGHTDVIETLLAMAEAEHRWGDARRALYLLDHVERILGTLPDRHQRLRLRCRLEVGRPALA